MTKPSGILTLDVEDWDHANFAQLAGRDPRLTQASPYAMDANTDAWIELLAATQAKSTCFVLGDFARRYPQAVRRLAQAGHEIACHGDKHELVYEMSKERFRESLRRALGELGSLTGQAPQGFRAPSWSVDPLRTPWLCDELRAQSVRYDSSEFPVRTPLFGHAAAGVAPHWEAGILRLPVTVLTIGRFKIPFSSGAFFRLSPLALLRFGFKQAIRQSRPAMVVLHPRELDPAHPRLPIAGWERVVHYARLESTRPKLVALLGEMRWCSIAQAYGSVLDTPGASLDNLV